MISKIELNEKAKSYYNIIVNYRYCKLTSIIKKCGFKRFSYQAGNVYGTGFYCDTQLIIDGEQPPEIIVFENYPVTLSEIKKQFANCLYLYTNITTDQLKGIIENIDC